MKKLPKKTTIVIVNDFDYIQGGASKVAIDTAKILHENGYHVIFFSGTHSTEEFTENGYQNITLNLPECLKDKNKIRGALRGLYNFKAKKEFKKLLDTLDPKTTIIHIHGWTKTLSSSVFDVADKQGFKVVVTLHDYFSACPNGGFFHYRQNQICKLKPLSRQCLCSNCDSRNYFFKIYRVIRQKKYNKSIKKLRYGIYISDFSLNILRPYLPQNISLKKIYNPIQTSTSKIKQLANNSYYLFVGRISSEKGVDIFCKVITSLNLKGVVVGSGNLLEKLKKEYPNISFVGWKSQSEVLEYMLKAKALIFPSKWYETAGLTVLEAHSVNLPCFVFDTTAASEFVTKDYLFHNILELEEKMKDFEQKIKQNKKFLFDVKAYDKDIYLKKLVNFYNEILYNERD